MLRRSAVTSLLVLGACVGAGLGACTTRTYQFSDGGLDAGPDGPTGDGPTPLALDLSVTGCASYSIADARCTGAPPLTLSFSPVGSPTLTRFVWTFGDGTPTSTDRAPTHTYALPGTYDVSVVADGPAGSVSRTRAKLVDVVSLAAGAPCDVDAQCAGGLACRCAGGSCGPAFARGVCSRACDAAGCGAGAACVAFSFPSPATGAPDAAADAGASPDARPDVPIGGATADAAEDESGDGPADVPSDAPSDVPSDAPSDLPADAPADVLALADAPGGAATDAASDGGATDAASAGSGACLATCSTDGDCAFGFACRATPASTGWTRVCLPVAYQDLGAPCRDDTGALDDGACASGHCADLGALGVCSAPCGAGATCPASGACATFGDGRALCLATCAADVTCARDPLLDCEAAGAAGALGFRASPPESGATYCAPRSCALASDCAPAGVCAPLGAGAHCGRI